MDTDKNIAVFYLRLSVFICGLWRTHSCVPRSHSCERLEFLHFLRAQAARPEQVRQDEDRAWKTGKIFYWQRGAQQRPLRLIVIAPTPYRKNNTGRRSSRRICRAALSRWASNSDM
jgi:hypothetical protein